MSCCQFCCQPKIEVKVLKTLINRISLEGEKIYIPLPYLEEKVYIIKTVA
jgi:hypothetical protein